VETDGLKDFVIDIEYIKKVNKQCGIVKFPVYNL